MIFQAVTVCLVLICRLMSVEAILIAAVIAMAVPTKIVMADDELSGFTEDSFQRYVTKQSGKQK